MKKLLISSLLLLVAMSVSAEPIIGIYTDELGTTCEINTTPYVQFNLYLVATWTGDEVFGGMTATEFKLDNFPTNDGYPIGTVTVIANDTDLIIGDIWTDWSVAWSEPQGGTRSMFTMATIEILPFDAGWIGADQVTVVAPGDDCSCLVIVDANFDIVDAVGYQFTFNCSTAPDCACSVAVGPSTWSSVKALF